MITTIIITNVIDIINFTPRVISALIFTMIMIIIIIVIII